MVQPPVHHRLDVRVYHGFVFIEGDILRSDVLAHQLHIDGYKDSVIDEIVHALKVAEIVREFVEKN
jgi:hypothetical protein